MIAAAGSPTATAVRRVSPASRSGPEKTLGNLGSFAFPITTPKLVIRVEKPLLEGQSPALSKMRFGTIGGAGRSLWVLVVESAPPASVIVQGTLTAWQTRRSDGELRKQTNAGGVT